MVLVTEETKATIEILDQLDSMAILGENIWTICVDETIVPIWLEGNKFQFSYGTMVFGVDGSGKEGFEFLEKLAKEVPSIAKKLAEPTHGYRKHHQADQSV